MFREHTPVLPFRSQRAAPRRTAAFNNSHSNDNRLGFRRPADQRRRPKPVLVCHWIEVGGRLECHWEVATDGAASQSERPRLTGSAFEPPLRPCVNGAQIARTAFDPVIRSAVDIVRDAGLISGIAGLGLALFVDTGATPPPPSAVQQATNIIPFPGGRRSCQQQ
jgi:hypothetical protein